MPSLDHPQEPADLEDLEGVRSAIDALDRQLVGLLVRRQHLVTRAADFKQGAGEVRATDRAAKVIENAAQQADEAGGSAEIVRRIYRAIIESYVSHELEVHHRAARPDTNV